MNHSLVPAVRWVPRGMRPQTGSRYGLRSHGVACCFATILHSCMVIVDYTWLLGAADAFMEIYSKTRAVYLVRGEKRMYTYRGVIYTGGLTYCLSVDR